MSSFNFTKASDHVIKTWNTEFYKDVELPESESGNKTWERFDNIIDPWNPENCMSGFVRRKSGDMYGCLKIDKVNGRPAKQLIYGTPKLSYPYTDDGRWLIDDVIDCHAYVKYDGTNVIAYSYLDADGKCFTSFKLRTRPFISPKFKKFWNILLSRYPTIKELKLEPNQAIAFEMFGNMNPMLIHYNFDLDLRVLYGRQNGELVTMHDNPEFFSVIDCPLAENYPWDINADYLEEYERVSALLAKGLKEIESNYYTGLEGYVMYCKFPARLGDRSGYFTRMIKLKAPAVVAIHREQKFVPRLEVEMTSNNLWEHFDNPTIDDLVTLLEEEWSSEQIERSTATISSVYNDVMIEREREERILDQYRKLFNDDEFSINKKDVMKNMAQYYDKYEMKKVFAVLNKRLGLG